MGSSIWSDQELSWVWVLLLLVTSSSPTGFRFFQWRVVVTLSLGRSVRSSSQWSGFTLGPQQSYVSVVRSGSP